MTPEVQERIRQISNGEIPKGYKKTKFGILPTDWKVVTIGECLERVEHPVDVQPDQMYTQIGIRSHGKGLFYKEPVSGTELGNKSVYWIEPDCFILNIVFAWEQAIARTTQAEVGMIGSHRFPMYKPVNDLVDIDYLVFYFQTKRGTDILESASPGGAGRNRTLGQERFLKSKIVLPSVAEQKRIVEIICEQDKVIELQQKKIDEIIKLKKGYFLKLFPREGTIVPKLRFKGFNGDWEQRKLGDLCQTSRLSVNPQDEADSWFYEYSMPAFDRGNGPDYVLGESMNSARIVIKEPCVLYNKLNVRKRRVWYVDKICGKSVCSGEFVPILSHNVDLPLLAQILISDKVTEDMEAVSSGTSNSQKRVQPSVIMDYNIVIPRDIAEQKAISDFMFGLDNTVFLHQRKLEQEKQKKKALMQLFLTGIVRV